jgi:hypothetical protein
MNLFGPAIATHRGNKIVIGILTLLAAGSAYLAWIKVHMPEENGTPGDYRIYIVISILLGAYAVWTSKRLVVLHAEGITYRNLLGEQQMKWDDVQNFYYSATKRSINFIPVGTYYSYKLLDAHGKKISLGTGIAQAKALGARLIELTQLPLLKKATEQFNNGANVDFGPIKLDRVKGITVKKWLRGWKQVPLSEVHAYTIQSGQFFIWGAGEKLLSASTLPDIPNAFVLHALLDAIFKPKAQSAQAR